MHLHIFKEDFEFVSYNKEHEQNITETDGSTDGDVVQPDIMAIEGHEIQPVRNPYKLKDDVSIAHSDYCLNLTDQDS